VTPPPTLTDAATVMLVADTEAVVSAPALLTDTADRAPTRAAAADNEEAVAAVADSGPLMMLPALTAKAVSGPVSRLEVVALPMVDRLVADSGPPAATKLETCSDPAVTAPLSVATFPAMLVAVRVPTLMPATDSDVPTSSRLVLSELNVP
jgi:hypothetical protein